MSYKNFIPTVWSEAINRDLERALVFAEDCNRQYEGDVKKMGDTVRILGVGKPTITETVDKEITLDDPENVEDTSVTMAIRHVAYFNYKVDDIDKRQAVGGVMEALQEEATQGVANKMDALIASQALSKMARLYSKDTVTLTAENALKELDKAATILYENDVHQGTKIIADVPPWLYICVKQAYLGRDTDNSSMMKNGRVYQYGDIFIKMSNNTAKNSAGDSMVMVRTQKAIAFANPMTHVEAYRPERGFSDAVKGFVLYDSKIVRPKELVVMNVKCG
ncbi:MAG TPA: hypothetical protein H9795_01550 [Candidatus Fournierella merdigallinarum]|nr:hypothetical protein [Candidatus Fournierella merdigallinarum]